MPKQQVVDLKRELDKCGEDLLLVKEGMNLETFELSEFEVLEASSKQIEAVLQAQT